MTNPLQTRFPTTSILVWVMRLEYACIHLERMRGLRMMFYGPVPGRFERLLWRAERRVERIRARMPTPPR